MDKLVLWFRAAAAGEDFSSAELAWARSQAQLSLASAGGELLGAMGSTLAFDFELTDLVAGLSAALEVLENALGSEEVPMPSIGAALGSVDAIEGTGPVGSGLIRAQHLCGLAAPGELLVCEATAEATRDTFLFARRVEGPGGADGRVLDADHPYRQACR
jgi:class 3 adenylate cyclase